MIDFVSEQMGAGSSAIAAAASQALAATHYNVPGRRSSSLKASFEAISQGIATSQLSIGQVLKGVGGVILKVLRAYFLSAICDFSAPVLSHLTIKS